MGWVRAEATADRADDAQSTIAVAASSTPTDLARCGTHVIACIAE
jgi:hypothetical protein